MDIKHLQFSFRMYWANMKGLLNMVAEGIILVASLASLSVSYTHLRAHET